MKYKVTVEQDKLIEWTCGLMGKPYPITENKKKGHTNMKKTEKELEEMGVYSERNYYSAMTVLCCGIGAGVCIALALLVEYLAGRF